MNTLNVSHKKKTRAVEAHGLEGKAMLQKNTLADNGGQDNAETLFDAKELAKSHKILERLLQKGQHNVLVEIIAITPELASLILQRNPSDENRKLSINTVAKYASDMADGRWDGLNGQTIVLSKDGYLNDGQHRLNAIITANMTIVMGVLVGADRNSRLTLDQNKVRTSGDYLHMQGVKNANNVATAAKIIMAYEAENLEMGSHRQGAFNHRAKVPTKAQIHAFAENHITEIEKCFDFGTDWKILPAPPSHIAAAKFILDWQAKSKVHVAEYMKAVIFGENLTRTSPAYHARNRMQSERLAGSLRPGKTLEIIFRGWNAERRDGRMSRMHLQGVLPEIEF